MAEAIEPAVSEPLVVDGVDSRGLIDKARAEGVSLADPHGWLSPITKRCWRRLWPRIRERWAELISRW